ncbi:hypothetical protein GCK72_004963 [Caenorhabditis remanei]|uniref:Uncharacterized protein n=1 Tax=Caenorhabditis remanei TaxID=31234 RepID=A0A6A5HFR5_CAERE|nr:hypothetical protein GCK72_004963 [Caenorhabditis remanei]KAF1765012.1 hypothetical protein GCK72_004963 [Caenorhabditis remanei]
MSDKYSGKTFFFADYGCCIPTESYAWILVALFITTILVLLMYKRRMRKRIHDLKRKFLMDTIKAQEFETKLNFVAHKNKGRNEEMSNEVGNDKISIYVNPNEQKQNSQKNKKKGSLHKAVVNQPGNPMNNDETPVAQSSLASKSKTNAKIKNENHWLHLPKNQKPKQVPEEAPPTPSPAYIPPVAPVVTQVKAPPPPPPPAQYPPMGTRPPLMVAQPKKGPSNFDFDFDTSPVISLDQSGTPPSKKIPLAPPTTTTLTSTTALTSASNFTTTPSTDKTTTPESTTPLTIGTTTPITTGSTVTSSTIPTSSIPPKPSPPKNKNASPGDNVKQNLKFGQEDIVSPIVGAEPVGRKDGAGGSTEWIGFYENKKSRNPTLSTITKSSTNNRRSTTGSWLFDSTGSSRSGIASGSVGKTTSTVSSSIIKTDTSSYKTASSVEKFPHGAYSFQ